MVLDTNGGGVAEEIKEDLPDNQAEKGFKADSCNNEALGISVSGKGLLGPEKLRMEKQGWLKVIPTRLNVLRSSSNGDLHSPSTKFRRIAEEREEMSRSVPSSRHGLRGRFSERIAHKIDWTSLWGMSRNWIRSPLNMVLLLWIICVAVSGAILFLVMTGMLNSVLPNKSQRNAWFEVNNQILNALFTLMCLYQHPKRFYHLALLCRWQPTDIRRLRKIYCKNGTYKPHEWAHMMVVVVLLHVNCFAQYALCSLNLRFRRSERPALGVFVCLSVAIAAPAIAGVYSIISPLGKDYDSESDEEAQNNQILDKVSSRRISLQKRFSFALRNERRIVEYAPTWQGGLLDIWENISSAFLSLFCTFCVFGWNMERLGFGNMYVHIATFLLFCTAPFWVFSLAAVNIDNEGVRQALVLSGLVLCVFGLLYGGFWRIQMRKRYNLPGNNVICGKPGIADCAQWLFCCWCSLAQEVRTADFYEIVEDKFCRKQTLEDNQPTQSPLPLEDGDQFRSSPTSQLQTNRSPSPSRFGNHSSPSPSRLSKDHYSPGRELARVEEQSLHEGDNLMKPPVLTQIQREEIRR